MPYLDEVKPSFKKISHEELMQLIYKKLDVTPTEEEKKYHDDLISFIIDQNLITEKNVSKTSGSEILDNYNLGNFIISKEKEADVLMTSIKKDFINEFLPKDEKEIIKILSDEGLSSDIINKYLIIYITIKIKKEKKNILKNIEDLNSYIID